MKLMFSAVASLLLLVSSGLVAQDVNAMAKWTALTVVHYRAVGEFAGETPILEGVKHKFRRSAKVTDRVELEFDWNQSDMNLVGKPVIKNFPTTVIEISKAHELGMTDCPSPRIDTVLELITVLSVKTDDMMRLSGIIGLESKRDQPAGAIPYPATTGGKCDSAWDTSPAKSETTVANLMVVPAMYLAMPGGAPFTLTPDGKSIVLKEKGWTWTYTPTPGK